MAKRKEKPSHLGLKEAYSVLQKDFLNLQNHCAGIEQHLMEMEKNYLILDQLYQQQQQDSQEQKANLIEKLEKSYDAYNEKYVEVELLEEKLKSKNEQVNRNEERNKTSREVWEREDQLQTQIFEEVQKSLSKVGLSLVKSDEEFIVNVLDIKNLEQLLSIQNCCIVEKSIASEVNDLKQSKNLLEEAFSSLKQHSENQDEVIFKIHQELRKKTDECLSLYEEINQMKKKNEKMSLDIATQANARKQVLSKEVLSVGKNKMMKRDVVERIVAQLYEMCDFMAVLKKTIIDQSSWIEMLMASMNEYKGRISRKPTDNGNTQSSINSQKKHFDVSCSKGKNESDVATGIESLNTDQSSPDTLHQQYSETFCMSRSRSSTECDENIVDHRIPRAEDPSQLGETVPDGRKEHSKFSSASNQTSLLDHQENVLRQRDMFQASNVDRSTCIDVSEQQHQQYLATDDMCPMCNVIFDSTYDLARRRSHINNHFYN